MISGFPRLFLDWSKNSALSQNAAWVDVMTFFAAFLHEMRGVHDNFLSRRKVECLFESSFSRRTFGEERLVVDLIELPFGSVRLLVTSAGEVTHKPLRREHFLEHRRLRSRSIIVALFFNAVICLKYICTCVRGDQVVEAVVKDRVFGESSVDAFTNIFCSSTCFGITSANVSVWSIGDAVGTSSS